MSSTPSLWHQDLGMASAAGVTRSRPLACQGATGRWECTGKATGSEGYFLVGWAEDVRPLLQLDFSLGPALLILPFLSLGVDPKSPLR